MNERTATIQPNEVIAGINITDGQCTVECSVLQSFIQRECKDLQASQIAVAALQFIVQQEGIFVAGNPKLNLNPLSTESSWKFSATFPILEKPVLDPLQLIEELKNSLHDEDLESVDECKNRLFAIIESKITYPLPKEFLISLPNPVEAISTWKNAIAKSALADIELPDQINQSSLSYWARKPRTERTNAAIDWILQRTVTTTTSA